MRFAFALLLGASSLVPIWGSITGGGAPGGLARGGARAEPRIPTPTPPPSIGVHFSLGPIYYGQELSMLNGLPESEQGDSLDFAWSVLGSYFHTFEGQQALGGTRIPSYTAVVVAADAWLDSATSNGSWDVGAAVDRRSWQKGGTRKHRYTFVLTDGGDGLLRGTKMVVRDCDKPPDGAIRAGFSDEPPARGSVTVIVPPSTFVVYATIDVLPAPDDLQPGGGSFRDGDLDTPGNGRTGDSGTEAPQTSGPRTDPITVEQPRVFVGEPPCLRVDDALFTRSARPMTVLFNLRKDLALPVRLERLPNPAEESVAWSGTVLGGERRGVVTAVVRRVDDGPPRFRAQITDLKAGIIAVGPCPTGEPGDVVVETIDPGTIPDCETSTNTIETGDVDTVDCAGMPPAEPNGHFDVVVVYTPAAAIGACGEIDSLIDLGVAQTNAALAQAMGQEKRVLRVVGRQQVDYQESPSFGVMLQDLLAGTGALATAHQLREQKKADMTMLMVGNPCKGGLAMPMYHASHAFCRDAFSVVSVRWATTNYSFTHELGHNMGCCHAVSFCSPPAAPELFVAGGEAFRTMMGEKPLAQRVPFFSNPSQDWLGVPIGATGVRDNALVIRTNAKVIEGWR